MQITTPYFAESHPLPGVLTISYQEHCRLWVHVVQYKAVLLSGILLHAVHAVCLNCCVLFIHCEEGRDVGVA